MKNRPLLSSALAMAALLSACGGAEAELPALDSQPETAQAESALQQASSTTGYYPVVQILIDNTWICSATAIADDLLLTAMHCIKQAGSTNVYDSVKVYTAHGDNDSAEGATSSYFLFSEDLYDGYYTNGSNVTRDIALIKFGPGTFSSTYQLGSVTSSLNGSTVTILGFGGDTTKEVGTDTVTWTTTDLSGTGGYIQTNGGNSTTNLEGGDSGGPILVSDGAGSYRVVGVNKSEGDNHTIVTSALYNYISTIRNAFVDNCVETFEHSNYDGRSWSWCLESSIQSVLNNAGFSDVWKIAAHGDDSTWNDEITSVMVPANFSLRMFQHSSFGGTSKTFQTMYSFGNAADVSSLSTYSFSDAVSSWKITYASSPPSLKWFIEITRHGKCLDVVNGWSANGTNIQQYSCVSTTTNQQFRLQAVGSYYQIIHDATGKCVDVSGGNSANGTNVQLWDCSTTNNNQLFTLSSNTSTSDARDFTIMNKATSKCLDLSAGGSADGTNIQIWDCSSGNSNQRFALKQY